MAPGPDPDAALGDGLPWRDAVAAAAVARLGEGPGRALVTGVVDGFPVGYRAEVDPATAVDDAVRLQQHDRHGLDLRVRATGGSSGRVRVLVADRPLVLSDFLPLLEDLGLRVRDEAPYRLRAPDGSDVHLHDFGVDGLPETFDDDVAARLAATVRASRDGRTTSDSLHRLVLTAGLTWREAALLRTYRRYRRQVGTPYTPATANDALAANAEVVRAVMAHVRARFDPVRAADAATVAASRDAALRACDGVQRLDHDRVLRGLVALVDATVRTNLHVPDVDVVVLKLDPSRVPDVPLPVPHREVFVLGAELEGVHLRGGPIARGGLRWSDRQDDVRTEVLDLLKAQMRKNAVIVPTGAKGGFVLRDPPTDRAALRAAVEAQYRVFVRSLLSVTDDLDGDAVVPPPHVRRWDGDDPYLVVAADKGTAALSDVANEVALAQGFWLGDAFASGGSNGYDHKALGITARGAWVAVRRHLLELGLDPEREPVDVAGVGDMSGDVFGNGMLSSRTIRLRAAFDHRHVLVDPDPDPAATYEERARLAALPGSSWADHDPAALSEGALVVRRDAKSVTTTPQVRSFLRLEQERCTPDELVRAVLCAPVDLLWFGGVGTYVKDPDESHAAVGDRAGDDVRVDADAVRARVLGEGANLAITQRARIRHARRGGRCDQDAIHNVGGVDCSDHEVNVKVLLDRAVRDGTLDRDERDRLLAQVAPDVVVDVLRNVDLQVWRLSRDVAEAPDRTADHAALLALLERDDGLDRDVEVLPGPSELDERARAGAGLVRPELATVLGWAKRRLTARLLGSDLPRAATVRPVLVAALPAVLAARLPEHLVGHRLADEIVATRIANEVVDRMGPTFPSRVAAEADVDEPDVAAAWWAAREVTGLDAAWRVVEGLLDLVGPAAQDGMARQLEGVLATLTRRYLADPLAGDLDALVARDQEAAGVFLAALPGLGTPAQRARREREARRRRDDLVDDALAARLACADEAALAVDVAATLRALGWPPSAAGAVGDVLLHLHERLGLARLQRVLDGADTPTVWRRRLRRALEADLRGLAAAATGAALREAGHGAVSAVAAAPDTAVAATPDTAVAAAPDPTVAADVGPAAVVGLDAAAVADGFLDRRADRLGRASRVVGAVEDDPAALLDGVAVALRSLRDAVG